ncbi:NAD(P)-binding domain-containing protein [Streptomyces sp. HUAS MG47]|uniref:NAD(P)-dependent oxidoreductase n=1 Tax=Streptomyces solicamelliae TaxID=3231716 RepID=UPI003877DB35
MVDKAEKNRPRVSVLGLGSMGSVLARHLIDAGYVTTVWNRTPGRADPLLAYGATEAETAAEAVAASDVVVVCLFDHASVHSVLDPLAGELARRAVVNVTTTKPSEARELGEWAGRARIPYLDGAIMAVPGMIGRPGATVLYSGSEDVFTEHRELLDVWAANTYYGEDAGRASLYDFALLSSMFVMFAGFMQGAALLAPAGVSAREFAGLAAPWLTAMTGELDGYAKVIDGGDYGVPGEMSLDFMNLGIYVEAAAEEGVGAEPIAMVQRLVQRQLDAGRGGEAFARIFESVRERSA